uniref:Hexosyltransferase n=1 Tax=Syphacia muris TaxID=451379 RepID=A0A0N5APK6_9BILA
MSGGIRKGINPTLRSLKKLMKKTPVLPMVEDESTTEIVYKKYLGEANKILQRMKGTVAHLEKQSKAWQKLITTLQGEGLDDEEKLYGEMTEDPEGMLQTTEEARRVISDLKLDIRSIERIRGLNNKVSSSKTDESTNRIRDQNPSGRRSHLSASEDLPELVMPTFDGKSEEWPIFWSYFEWKIGFTTMDPADKLARLRSGLKGSAKDSVREFAIIAENYPKVVLRMSRRPETNHQWVPEDITKEFAFHRDELDFGSIAWDKLYINRYNWTIVNPEFCRKRYPNVTTLLFIYTAPNHFQQRNLYRSMYGDRFYEQFGIVALFPLGIPSNSSLQHQILVESLKYGDIIQQSFYDAYETLTYKGLMWLQFVKENCNEINYAIKMDDDAVLNVYKMLPFLNSQIPNSPFYNSGRKAVFGSVMTFYPVNRDISSKWYTSRKEYGEDVFEIFCKGFMYVISGPLIPDILKSAENATFFKLEDVYITGLLAKDVPDIMYVDLTNYTSRYGYQEYREMFTDETIIAIGALETEQDNIDKKTSFKRE